jgi:peptidylprolyl isomerase
MEFVDLIKKGAGDSPVQDPDKIISAKIEYK